MSGSTTNFPLDPSTLPKYPDGTKLFSNALKWMTDGKSSPKVATNVDTIDKTVATYAKDPTTSLDTCDVFFAGNFGSWTKDSASKLLKFVEEGGSVVLGSADKWPIGPDREPLRM